MNIFGNSFFQTQVIKLVTSYMEKNGVSCIALTMKDGELIFDVHNEPVKVMTQTQALELLAHIDNLTNNLKQLENGNDITSQPA